MRILVVKPGKRPLVQEVDPTLEAMQKIVGGEIQAIYPFDDSAAIICCATAKQCGYPSNRALYESDGKTAREIIAGTFFLCDAPVWSERFLDLSDEQLERYSSLFSVPEVFLPLKCRTLIIPCKY